MTQSPKKPDFYFSLTMPPALFRDCWHAFVEFTDQYLKDGMVMELKLRVDIKATDVELIGSGLPDDEAYETLREAIQSELPAGARVRIGEHSRGKSFQSRPDWRPPKTH